MSRAYVIVHYKDADKRVMTLAGREIAVHKRALAQLHDRAKSDSEFRRLLHAALTSGEKLLDENGEHRQLGIGRNLAGVLMIGRTALPGGKVNRGELFRDAALRELNEEFGLNLNISSDVLVPLVQENWREFFTLDLDAVMPAANEFVTTHVKNFVEADDKRALATLTIDQHLAALAAPDDVDRTYMETQMRAVAIQLCMFAGLTDDSAAVVESLTKELVAYQLARQLPEQVLAMRVFATLQQK